MRNNATSAAWSVSQSQDLCREGRERSKCGALVALVARSFKKTPLDLGAREESVSYTHLTLPTN